jgi:hypothetical protein
MGISEIPIDTLKHVIEDVLEDGGSHAVVPILLTCKQWNVRI